MNIKLGLNDLKDIKIGSTSVKKVMVGATLLWELLSDLLPQFVGRVAADGGTYVGNTEVDEDIVMDSNLTLLMKPVASKTGKLYSAIPMDGSGDFIAQDGSEPTIEYDLVEDGVEMGPDKYGENLFPNNDTLIQWSSGKFRTSTVAAPPNTGLQYVWEIDQYVYTRTFNFFSFQGTETQVRVFAKTNSTAYWFLRVEDTNYAQLTITSTVTSVGDGWYSHVFTMPATAYRIRFGEATVIAGLQITTNEGGLDSIIETTGTEIPYANHAETVQLYKNDNFRVMVVKGGTNLFGNSENFTWNENSYFDWSETTDEDPLGGGWKVYSGRRTSTTSSFNAQKYLSDPATSGSYTFSYYSNSSAPSISFGQPSASLTTLKEDLGNGWYRHYATKSFTSYGGYIYFKWTPNYNITVKIFGLMFQKTTELNDYFPGYNTSWYLPYTISGDTITVTPPTGTQAIYETIDGVTNKSLTIPTTYQLPIGNVEMIKMGKYSHNSIEWVEPAEGEIYDGEITTLQVKIN